MIWDSIVLFLLGLLTVRDLISKNFNIPKNKSWSWLFYNKNECEDIPYCYQLSLIKKNKPPINYHSELLPKLILVLGNHTKFFEEGVFCDRSKRIRVNYLVSTLEASHDIEDLKVMVDVIEKLYFGICDETHVDFVISLKGGNVLLVNRFVQLHQNELMHITYNRNLFFESFGIVSSNVNDVVSGIGLKFENMEELIRIAKLSERKLNGIILDCSFSSGEGIIQCVKEFNDMLNDNTNKIVNINPITEVRVIYSHIGENIEDRLNELNCNIEYLFSLDSERRKQLFESICQEQQDSIKLRNAYKILAELKKDKLLNDSLII